MAQWCEDRKEWVWSNSFERLLRSKQEGPRKARKVTAIIFATVVGAPCVWISFDAASGFNLAADVQDVFPKPELGQMPEGAEDCHVLSSDMTLVAAGDGCTEDVIHEVQDIRTEYEYAKMRYTLAYPYLSTAADIGYVIKGNFLPN